MRLVRLIRGWWIVRHCPPVGPYKTKQEAKQVMRGLRRFYSSQGISNPYHKGDKMQTTKTAMATLFAELGFPMADKWNVAQLKRKAKTLPKLVDEDTSLETEGSQALLDELLAALENNDEIEISEDESEEEEAAPAKKAGKGKPAKVKVKAAAEDEEDSEEEEDESKEDEDDSEEEEEEPAPKKKGGKDKPAAAGKAPPKKAGGEKGPGVIASIIEFLEAASEEKPLSKDKIVERLAKRFPDRDPESMSKTVAVQVPNRLKSDKGLNIKKNDRGYWIAGKKK